MCLPHLLTIPAMILFWIIFIRKQTQEKLVEFRICMPKRKKVLAYIDYCPLLLIPVVNIAFAVHQMGGFALPHFQITELIMMLCSAWGEEVLFRGVIPRHLGGSGRRNALKGTVASSLLFAVMHLTNAFTYASVGYSCIQGLYAGAMGFCFAVITEREQSILPVFLIHSMINATAFAPISTAPFGERVKMELSDEQSIVFLLLTVIYIVYGICLYQAKKRGEQV